ncbi:hypothetical protein FRC11_002419 [Ceratobasidium sp. 423]|nr:hypothetical protein FRC11_002419 [Ceratobasidium sp. 423]
MSKGFVVLAAATSPFDKLPDEIITMIVTALGHRDARKLMRVNNRFHKLAMGHAWYEVHAIQALLSTVPEATEIPDSDDGVEDSNDVSTDALSTHYVDLIDRISLPIEPPKKSIERLLNHGDHVRILHLYLTSPDTEQVFRNIEGLKSQGYITPRLEKLVIHPGRSLSGTLKLLIELCVPPSLKIFTIAPLPPRCIVPRMRKSEGQELLNFLCSNGIRPHELELDAPRRDEDPDVYLISNIDALLVGVTRLSFDARGGPVIPNEVLWSLPQLAHLRVLSAWDWSRFNPFLPPLQHLQVLPSLKHLELINVECSQATEIIGTCIPPCLQTIMLHIILLDDDPNEPNFLGANISHLLDALVRHADTLRVVCIHCPMEASTLPYTDPERDVTELDAAAIHAVSQLHQLMEMSIVGARAADQSQLLEACSSWPLLIQLHMPEQLFGLGSLMTLASACPHLARLSVRLSPLQNPPPSLLTSPSQGPEEHNGHTLPDRAESVSLVAISNNPLVLTCDLEDCLESEMIRGVARFILRCWKGVKVRVQEDSPLDNAAVQKLSEEICKYQQ